MVLGLGLAVGAVLQQPLQAQQDTTRSRRDTTARRDTTGRRPPARGDSVRAVVPAPPQADTLLADSLRKRDSTRAAAVPLPGVKRDTVKRDTLKAPLAHAEAPPLLDVGDSYVWDRASLFASGALTAQDLVDRIPGITGFRAGWISAPMSSAYMGDPGRLRVFYDGLEIDNLDPRTGGVLDLTQIQIWTLEEARIERGASEVRLYLRSWRVDRTTPQTRTDVSTGDQQTNMYRGFFGRRYAHGEDLQVGAQQYGTTPGQSGASSDQTTIMGRVGWAARGISVDGFLMRSSRHRGVIYSVDNPGDSLLGVESSRSDVYLRAAYGDPDNGPWIQAMAGAENYRYTGVVPSALLTDTARHISADTSVTHPQYVLTGGLTKWGVRFSGTQRIRGIGFGRRLGTPSARASYTSRMLALSAFAETESVDSIARTEVMGRLTPLSFISISGAVGRATDKRSLPFQLLHPITDSTRTEAYRRVEAGLRLKGLWLSGGLLHRDAVTLLPPRVFDTAFVRVDDKAATATFASIRGRLYEDIYADVMAMKWSDTAGWYRPRYQARSELGVRTSWLSRFPSGDFGFHFALIHEYRGNTHFPVSGGEVVVPGSRTINSLLEIRILSATVFFQMRNMLGERYFLVPNYRMPRQTSIYGARWEFWN